MSTVTDTAVMSVHSNGCGSTSTASDSDSKGSSSDSGDSGSSDFKTNDVAIKIAKAFASAGYSKASTAGVIGNVSLESSFDSAKSGIGGAYGLGQWDPRSKIRTWMDANGMKDTPDSDEDGQIKMLVATAKSSFNNLYLAETKKEITVKNDSLYDTWHEATTPEDAAVAWMAGWERPGWDSRHEDERRQVAKDYYEKGLNGISFNGKSDDSSDDDSDSSQCCTQSDDSDGTVDNASDNVTVTNSVQAYTDKYGQAAFDIGKKYGIPYEAILGQSAIESGWGASTLTTKYHNFFGIKAVNGQKSVTMATKECNSGGCYDTTGEFAVYDSDADGFAGYGKFITENPRYAKALQKRTDPHAYIQELKNAGYATSNDYVNTVWGVTQQFISYIKQTNKFPPSSEVQFDSAPPSDSSDSDGSSDDSSTENVSCPTNSSDDEGSAENGEIGGAPTNTDNYAWMCSGKAKICKNGDTGPSFLWNGGANYQCYWYWLMRSYMVFGSMENPHTMTGGDLYADLQGKQGWTTSKTPKPGAGVAFKDSAGAVTHVAFVEKVATDSSGKWKIFISEGNARDADIFGHWNEYNTRWITPGDKWYGYIQGFFWRTEWKMS